MVGGRPGRQADFSGRFLGSAVGGPPSPEFVENVVGGRGTDHSQGERPRHLQETEESDEVGYAEEPRKAVEDDALNYQAGSPDESELRGSAKTESHAMPSPLTSPRRQKVNPVRSKTGSHVAASSFVKAPRAGLFNGASHQQDTRAACSGLTPGFLQ